MTKETQIPVQIDQYAQAEPYEYGPFADEVEHFLLLRAKRHDDERIRFKTRDFRQIIESLCAHILDDLLN